VRTARRCSSPSRRVGYAPTGVRFYPDHPVTICFPTSSYRNPTPRAPRMEGRGGAAETRGGSKYDDALPGTGAQRGKGGATGGGVSSGAPAAKPKRKRAGKATRGTWATGSGAGRQAAPLAPHAHARLRMRPARAGRALGEILAELQAVHARTAADCSRLESEHTVRAWHPPATKRERSVPPRTRAAAAPRARHLAAATAAAAKGGRGWGGGGGGAADAEART
jgi:hypothetical protein